MSRLTGKAGAHALTWLSAPKGASGRARVQLAGGKICDVAWSRDEGGIWIELPHGVFGYDIVADRSEEEGLSYRLTERIGSGSWGGARFRVASDEVSAGAGGAKKKGARVKAQMPGKITRVLVKSGDSVEKDQPLLVIEAMKMENEIRAPQAGKLSAVSVSAGQAVDTGAELLRFE